MSDECTCGRPRATAADLERWNAETPRLVHDMAETVRRLGDRNGGSAWTEQADPGWSRALCWTRRGERCGMRRRWASDTHIGEARRVLAVYLVFHAELCL